MWRVKEVLHPLRKFGDLQTHAHNNVKYFIVSLGNAGHVPSCETCSIGSYFLVLWEHLQRFILGGWHCFTSTMRRRKNNLFLGGVLHLSQVLSETEIYVYVKPCCLSPRLHNKSELSGEIILKLRVLLRTSSVTNLLIAPLLRSESAVDWLEQEIEVGEIVQPVSPPRSNVIKSGGGHSCLKIRRGADSTFLFNTSTRRYSRR